MERPDQEKDQYDQLDKLVGSCPKYDAILILEALKDENVSKKFADSISLKLHHLQNDTPLQVIEHCNKCAEIINSAATTHLKKFLR